MVSNIKSASSRFRMQTPKNNLGKKEKWRSMSRALERSDRKVGAFREIEKQYNPGMGRGKLHFLPSSWLVPPQRNRNLQMVKGRAPEAIREKRQWYRPVG